ncbi:MAG: hypothetical protein RIR51_565 [Bacteroidota bacterium]
MKNLFIFCLALLSFSLVGQVKFSTSGDLTNVDNSAVLELESTNKGLLLPRVVDTSRNIISNPAVGLVVFSTSDSKIYNFTSTGWKALTYIDTNSLSNRINTKLSKTDTASLSNRINKKIDNVNGVAQNLSISDNINVNGIYIGRGGGGNQFNLAFGEGSLQNNTYGNSNLAIGPSVLYSNIDGSANIGIGREVLYFNTGGIGNTGIGYNSLNLLENGSENIAIGDYSGSNLTEGNYNISITSSIGAGFPNPTGSNQLVLASSIYGKNIYDSTNVLLGIGTANPTTSLDVNGPIRIRGGSPGLGKILTSDAEGNASWELPTLGNDASKLNQTNGVAYNLSVADSLKVNGIYIGRGGAEISSNLAIGPQSLLYNSSGINNSSIGNYTLRNNTTGQGNTGLGAFALYSNFYGEGNTSLGTYSLFNSTGNFNTAVGYNVMIGKFAGNNNIGIGYNAGNNFLSGNNNIALGTNSNFPLPNGSNQLVLGSSIYGRDVYDSTIVLLGIGTASPTTTLDLKGGLRLRTTGTPGFGKVLTSDNYGNASWENLSVNGTEIFNTFLLKNDTIALSRRIESKIDKKLDKSNGTASNLTISDSLKVNGIFLGRGKGEKLYSLALGIQTLFSNTSGDYNSAGGYQSLNKNTFGASNSAWGAQSLYSNTTGNSNNAFGSLSLFTNSTGQINSAFGTQALYNNTSGSNNSGFGNFSLYANSTGNRNTAIGAYSLRASNGNQNIAIGDSSGYNLTTGNKNILIGSKISLPISTASNQLVLASSVYGKYIYDSTSVQIGIGTANPKATLDIKGNLKYTNGTATNLTISDSLIVKNLKVDKLTIGNGNGNIETNQALGIQALSSNTSGQNNLAIGNQALNSNNTGFFNVAIGNSSLTTNSSGFANLAFGFGTLTSNTTGSTNLAIGISALGANTSGGNNTAIGSNSLVSNTTGQRNTALGYFSLRASTGNQNIAIGDSSGFNLNTGNKNIIISSKTNFPDPSGSNQLVIGSSFYGKNIYDSTAVKLGIGTANPTASLDVQGTLRIRGGVPGTGKILTSDTNGNATWSSDLFNNKLDVTNGTAYNLNVADNLTVNGITVGLGGGDNNANTALGFEALKVNTHYGHTSIGYQSLFSNTIGTYNTALGYKSLFFNTIGEANTGIGVFSLYYNKNGHSNTSLGYASLYENISGNWNTSIGLQALYHNKSGNNNTGIGYQSSNLDTSGSNNTSIGAKALISNKSGNNNTTIGYNSGNNLTSGDNNIAIGSQTIFLSTTGSNQLTIASSIYGKNIYDSTSVKLGIGTANPTATLDIMGSLKIRGENSKISMETGQPYSSTGTFTLNAQGNAIVNATGVTNNSIILLTPQSGQTGNMAVITRSAGQYFQVSSSGGSADNGKVIGYLIIN